MLTTQDIKTAVIVIGVVGRRDLTRGRAMVCTTRCNIAPGSISCVRLLALPR